MTFQLTPHVLRIHEKIAGFAKKEVVCRANQFCSGVEFPVDIWQKMGKEGLLALNLPRSQGGMGCDPLCTLAALEIFARHAKGMGLAFSWLIHLVLTRYIIMEFGTGEQKEKYLPGLAQGKLTASLAISEPNVGAHPKHLKTTALSDGKGFFTLNGEKSFLTNGPIADLFIVFAVSSIDAGRNGFSAFLVERNTPGLSFTPEFDIGCLYPSAHCGMKLKDCRIADSFILGKKDSAYEQMAKPFRAMEDVFMTGLALGGMEVQLDALVSAIRGKAPNYPDKVKTGLGELRSLLDSLRVLVYEIGRLSGENDMESPEVLSLVLSFRNLSNYYQSRLELLRNRIGDIEDLFLSAITRDLVRLAGIAKDILLLKQAKIGESLLFGKEFDV